MSTDDDIQMRSDWLIPLCTGPERLRNQHGLNFIRPEPEALLHRVLLASTGHDDIVLDRSPVPAPRRLSRAVSAGISSRSTAPAYVEAAWDGSGARARLDEGIAMTPTKRDAPRFRSAIWWQGVCLRERGCSIGSGG